MLAGLHMHWTRFADAGAHEYATIGESEVRLKPALRPDMRFRLDPVSRNPEGTVSLEQPIRRTFADPIERRFRRSFEHQVSFGRQSSTHIHLLSTNRR